MPTVEVPSWKKCRVVMDVDGVLWGRILGGKEKGRWQVVGVVNSASCLHSNVLKMSYGPLTPVIWEENGGIYVNAADIDADEAAEEAPVESDATKVTVTVTLKRVE